MFESLLNVDSLISLLTLSALEIVLGIDNIIFIAILVAKVPRAHQPRTRTLGIGLALLIRLGLLFFISALMSLTEPFITIVGHGFSARDLILLFGGLFLIGKSTFEIHEKLETAPSSEAAHEKAPEGNANPNAILAQILILDIVFSLDSVITAVGMANQVPIMVVAMVIAMAVMLFSAGAISDFVHRHPTIKILALSFLLLIGVMLVTESMGAHVSKGYIYFAMAFSLGVELLNLKFRKKSKKPFELNEPSL